jgi:NTE family protein
MSQLFEGLEPEQLAPFERLERRSVPAGAVVLAEGDALGEMFLISRGTVEVLARDSGDREHQLGRLGPGSTVGEMSLFTGEPASATVRAATDLEVVVLRAGDVERLGDAAPRLYRNLAAMLAERLARTNRLAVRAERGRVSVLLQRGGSPQTGYALAASLAWHLHDETLLLVVGENPGEELSALADRDRTVLLGATAARAHVFVTPPVGQYAADSLPATVEGLRDRFRSVLVQLEADIPSLAGDRIVVVGPGVSETGSASLILRSPGQAGAPLPRPGGAGELAVPPLSSRDEEALAAGTLPPATDAGKAVGWAARHLAGLKVGVALGAGNSKGYAHIGVLQALERAGVPIDVIAGTSAGAAVGAAYAAGFGIAEIGDLLDACGRTLFRPTISRRSLLSSRALRETIGRIAGDRMIEDLPIPFAVVATDLLTGNEVVLERGRLAMALLASISMPGLYPAQRVGPYALVDGGLLNPVPTSAAAKLGADVVIGVKLGRSPSPPEVDAEAVAGDSRVPTALDAITRSLEIMQGAISTAAADTASIVINLDSAELAGLELRRFSRGRRFVPVGVEATEAALPRIASVLPWVRP